MESKVIWKQDECEQYEDDLSLITIAPTYYPFNYSKDNTQSDIIRKLKLFQQAERKLWKGINVSSAGQPGIIY